MRSNVVLETRSLSMHFGGVVAVDRVDFSLRENELRCLIGPNGAGKTTLIKILSGLTKPTSGAAKVAGYNVIEGSPEMRKEIGVISHATALYADLTPLENLIFFARMHGLNKPKEQSLKVIDEVGLGERRNDRVRTFSRGMLQRLSIARAILHDPAILFLDEPFTGLDLHASNILKKHLQRLHDRRRTILMITHDIACGLEMCDKVALQVRGKFVYFENITNVNRDQFESMYFDAIRDNQLVMNQS